MTVVVDDVEEVACEVEAVEVGAEGAVVTVVVAARGARAVEVVVIGTRTTGTSSVSCWSGCLRGASARMCQ